MTARAEPGFAPAPSGGGLSGWIGVAAVVVFAVGATIAVRLWLSSAARRLEHPTAEKPKAAVA